MEENERLQIWAISVVISVYHQTGLELQISSDCKWVTLKEDSALLSAKAGDVIIGINDKNIVGMKTLLDVQKLLLKLCKDGDIVTFTMVAGESINHDALANLDKVSHT